MHRALPFVIIAGVALATLGGGIVMYRAYRPAMLDASKSNSSGGANEILHVRGAGKAPVTLEEYGDFQCPPCGELSGPLNQLEHDYRGKVRLIFRNFPLINHAHAKAAAYAAEAAGLQGRFWEMHELLYREQANWSKAASPNELFAAYARSLGLNMGRFEHDRSGDEVKAHVAADQKRAADLGVTVTPTLFLNGKSLPNTSLNVASLRVAVDAALAQQPAASN